MKEVNEIDKDIAKKIAMKIESFNLEKIGIEDIQDNVENELMAYNLRKTAKAYIRYRYKRELVRQGNTTDKTIMELLNGNSEYWNTENSNKNPKVVTTQRDYIAGATSTDITRRFLLPKDVIEAHDKGIIHFHDMDYMAQNALNNCFSGDTKLITNLGVKRFDEFYDGDIIQVKDKDGIWRSATVKKYGKQKMYDITFKTPKMKKTITCTDNHRWILKDGSVTTNLNVGDELYLLNDSRVNIDQENLEECRAFAFGFIIGDGCDITNSIGVAARLCGDKIKYKDIFTKAGYQISKINNSDDINVYNKKEYSKQTFLNNFSWRVISLKQKIALFNGYYAADGRRNANEISTSDKRIALMIEEISSLAGYYVSSTKEEIRNTNLKKDAYLKTYHFVVSQPSNLAWKVESITPHFNIKYKDNRRKNSFRISNTPIVAWCVEEPTTHSFTLDGGVVTGNCCLINLDDMLQNGTVINGVKIDPQHRLLTATTVSTQIITAVASSQYGGTTITLTHLAPYVRMSYENYLKDVTYELKDFDIPQDEIKKIALKRLKKEIKDAVQTFNYQINSMSTTNGQSPFLSVCMYLNENPEYTQEVALLIEEFLNQRMLGMKNEMGVYVTPAFPKLLYVLDENNIHEDSKYWYLTELAAKCTAKRMVPDYISAKIMKEIKGDVYPCMGCRSFLTPDRIKGNPAKAINYHQDIGKYYGRFNVGVVTINLVDVALSSKGNFDEFWELLEERCELCHKGLKVRIKRLEEAISDVAPILWQHGAFARLKSGKKIKPLIHGGYATASLGYGGLYECVKYMTNHSHTDNDVGKKFALEVMQKLNDMCNKWKTEEDIDYSLYGTPMESTTYKFARCLQDRFGIIEDVTDHDYITNSYHVNVREKIDPFSKLKLEAEFQKLSPGGAISYVETANLQNNVEAVLEVIKFIYNNIMYAELNTKSDYCQKCGYDGELLIDENMEWYCPNCGNRDQTKMNVARRTCGYIGSHFWNYGRTEEIKERYVHLGSDD